MGKVTITLSALALIASAALVPALAQQGSPCCRDWWGPGWMGPGHMTPDGMGRDMWGWGMMGPGQQARMQRHWTYMNEGVPSAYRGARNPLRSTDETLAAGATLYAENCARCHGPTGFGDGEEGRSLTPSPALLNYLVQMPMAGDEYLLWTVSEGGKAFETAMPAFKDSLSEDQIWSIIAYMRAGFPSGQQ
ncbi:cytochrome c [Rhodobacteraceae bacterium HSP-20]|jgi:mono/diheme cytochrome c family protein|uniref:Cytochrome c n=2 Tax=Paracoccaceae TaxID=31989 RepID=A0A3S8UCQ1_9RHOB|nr:MULTISPECIES: cytochrome c [Paracoccaceae]AZL61341.1 cytochrome c [Tabrizicola piscis]MBL9045758.1 cytochrome c [Tabrizicola sp.]MBU9699753.1 cytochrome c [Rhodobacter amnigenus]MBV4390980.1 cytochrome c [Rhodobacter amnigenus]